MVGTDKVRFGIHRQLRYLPKKIANFLHEFRADDFPSLNLPLLPSDRSRLDVHAMLRPADIARILQRLKVLHNNYILITGNNDIIIRNNNVIIICNNDVIMM
jgi:hypothetical protein